MVAFARFVMRDNGLAIHINAQQVTQVRQTSEGDPAIYTLGRDTPMIVEGTLEAAVRKLEAAAAGIKVVEPAMEPEAQAPATAAKSVVVELVPSEPAAEALPAAAPAAEAASPLETTAAAGDKAKPAKTKSGSAKTKPAKAKSAKAAKTEEPLKPAEPPYPAASWFMGNR